MKSDESRTECIKTWSIYDNGRQLVPGYLLCMVRKIICRCHVMLILEYISTHGTLRVVCCAARMSARESKPTGVSRPRATGRPVPQNSKAVSIPTGNNQSLSQTRLPQSNVATVCAPYLLASLIICLGIVYLLIKTALPLCQTHVQPQDI